MTAWERVERLMAATATETASGRGRGPVSPASMPTSSAFLRTSANGFGEGAGYSGGAVSESVLGDCLRFAGVPRDSFVVATKCGRYKEGFNFSAARVTRSVDESLARLGLDYVDILHCHDIEFTNLDQIVNETIPALLKIKESGKARFIGITGLPLSIFTYVLDRVPPGSVDLVLSYCHYGINDTALVDLLPYLKSKGVGVISASPLAMGLLTDNGPPEWHPAPEQLKDKLFLHKSPIVGRITRYKILPRITSVTTWLRAERLKESDGTEHVAPVDTDMNVRAGYFTFFNAPKRRQRCTCVARICNLTQIMELESWRVTSKVVPSPWGHQQEASQPPYHPTLT
ncbi:putative oxidoreductase YajO [Triticum urartu]|uniref:Putative oxidoreductase YajO n=1 Tax=Triticum urartu TaxID=4572 RepID=M8ADX9_TRIUA|nr:putative oxidoreductase YajO [Triticum urartu]